MKPAKIGARLTKYVHGQKTHPVDRSRRRRRIRHRPAAVGRSDRGAPEATGSDRLVCRGPNAAELDGPSATRRFQPERHREVIAEVWYPATQQAGTPCPYFPELGAISTEMVNSGALTRLEAGGLNWIRSNASLNADFADVAPRAP